MKTLKEKSKFLSFVLRHHPEEIGLKLDASGWVNIDDLLSKIKQKGHDLDESTLQTIVQTNDKKRFAISEDGLRIRASQGHSIEIELKYETKKPPLVLYHGTAIQFVSSILSNGLLKMNRHHVHLSTNLETALKVGQRHGKPAILTIKAHEMFEDGYLFYESENNVWLCEFIPIKYLKLE